MKAIALCWAAMSLTAGMAWAADAADAELVKPAYRDRVEFAERRFDDVRFIIGAGNASRWLEMYVGANFVAAFRDFEVAEVIASPDHQHFLALSNAFKSTYAYVILDRKGNITASLPHGGDLHYCNRTAWGVGEWVDASNPRATFSMEKNQLTTPASVFLMATVRGCDGRTVIVARPPAPSLKASAPLQAYTPMLISEHEVEVSGTRISAPPVSDTGKDRGSFFIGNTIANLRGQDPAFHGRTLTLVDGRRVSRAATRPVTIRAVNVPAAWTGAALVEHSYCITGSACSAADLLVSHADGSTKVIGKGLIGDFLALPGPQRVFACGRTAHAGEKADPVIVDLEGNTTTLPAHPGPVRICVTTGSGNEVLVAYTMAEVGVPFTLARVFDAGGALLAERRFGNSGMVEFHVDGKRYREAVPGP